MQRQVLYDRDCQPHAAVIESLNHVPVCVLCNKYMFKKFPTPLSKHCNKSQNSELCFGRALIFLLLLSGDIEVNPGPPSCAPSIHFAHFNSQSIHPNNTVDKPTILN